jgi:hypothetical protein
MCPHTIIEQNEPRLGLFKQVAYCYMCPHPAMYVSSYDYMCPHTTICVLILLYVSSYYYRVICVSAYYFEYVF